MNIGMIFSNLFKNVGTFTKTNAPTLLTGTGLALGATTVVLVAKKSPEAKKRKEKALIKANAEGKTKLATTMDVVKAVAPVYALPIATGLAAGGCIIASDIVVNKRLTTATRDLAAVTAGYAALQDKFNNYKETAKEVLGENKAADLKRKAAERDMQNSEAKEENAKELKYTNEGDKQLVYDPYVKDYYKSSIPDMLKVVSKLSIRTQGSMDGYIPFTDWYDEIGYRLTQEERIIYSGYGFVNSVHNPEDCMGFDYTAALSPNDTPCLQVEFNNLIPLWQVKARK